MHFLMARSSATAPAGQAAPAAGAPVLTIPARLLSSEGDNPLTIGLYCLIVRLYLIYQELLPISASDLAGYDPCASAESIGRALRRLRTGGWVVVERRGNKNSFRPTWGLVAGQPRLWERGRRCLGRPGHIATAPLDTRLLDVCLGRIEPAPILPAPVTRYVSAPLLSLRDVGAYLLARRGLGKGTPALARLGLVVDGMARELGDINEILAAVSQLQLTDPTAPTLTERGLRRLGIEVPKTSAAPGQFLVFMPVEDYRRLAPKIGQICARLCGGLFTQKGQKTPLKNDDSAALGADNLIEPSAAEKWTWKQKHLNHDSSMESAPEEAATYVNQNDPKKLKRKRKPKAELAPPATPAAEILLELDISIHCVRELHTEPLERIETLLAYARGRSDIANLGGWLVTALRDARDNGWRPARFRQRPGGYELLDLEKYTTGKFADVFNRDQGVGAPPTDDPLAAEPPVWGPPAGAATLDLEKYLTGKFADVFQRDQGSRYPLDTSPAPAGWPPAALEPAGWPDDWPEERPELLAATEDDLLFALRRASPTADWSLIGRLTLIELADGLALSCQTAADRWAADQRLGGILARVCAELCWPAAPQLVVGRGPWRE